LSAGDHRRRTRHCLSLRSIPSSATIECMAQGMFDVECPCCQAVLKIDPETRAVIAHSIPEKPRLIDDLAAEVEKLKGAGARREEIFQKQFEAEKSHGKVLEKKFDELFKRAKENPDDKPPMRDIDLD
jgi:hypothetical protein